MTAQDLEQKIPEVLNALRSVPLRPDLEEARDLLLLSAEVKPAADGEPQPARSWSDFVFEPIPIQGEPLSVTIIRDREDRF